MTSVSNIHNLSIVRRGNHFIYVRAPYTGWLSGWALIDGPWYSYLHKMSAGKRFVEVIRFSAVNFFYRDDEVPSPSALSPVVWEKLPLSNHFIHPRQIRDHFLAERWSSYLQRRAKMAFRLFPDGALPAYLDQMEFEEDYQKHLEHTLWCEQGDLRCR